MITTSEEFKKCNAHAHSEFYPVAQIKKENDGIALHFPPDAQLVICNDQIRNNYLSSYADSLPVLLTRAEFQAENNKNIPDNHRLVTIGTFITVQTNYGDITPLLVRNGNIIESGCLTYPSGLLSEAPQTALWRETNEELGIIADGQIVIVNPTSERHMDDVIKSYKLSCKSRNEILKNIFETNSQPFLKVPSTPTYNNSGTKINFSGIYNGSMNLIAIDNPSTHTINLINTIKIDLKGKKELRVFDPEHLNRDTEWIPTEELESTSHPKTFALKQFLKMTDMIFS